MTSIGEGLEVVEDYYEVLGIPATKAPSEVTEADVKSAFRRLSLELHPDTNKSPIAGKQFERLNRAYETLSDPVKKAAYDRQYAAVQLNPEAWGYRRAEIAIVGALSDPDLPRDTAMDFAKSVADQVLRNQVDVLARDYMAARNVGFKEQLSNEAGGELVSLALAAVNAHASRLEEIVRRYPATKESSGNILLGNSAGYQLPSGNGGGR